MKKYQIIYADPPWKYNFSPSNKTKIEQYYKTLSENELANLSIDKIADENCILYLWATSPKLLEALKIMKAWGFDYKTCAVWDKDFYWNGLLVSRFS